MNVVESDVVVDQSVEYVQEDVGFFHETNGRIEHDHERDEDRVARGSVGHIVDHHSEYLGVQIALNIFVDLFIK